MTTTHNGKIQWWWRAITHDEERNTWQLKCVETIYDDDPGRWRMMMTTRDNAWRHYFKFYYILNVILFWTLTPFYIKFNFNSIYFILFLNLTLFWIYFCSKHFLLGMPYLLIYFMFKFATLMLSYSTFFGDDAMLMPQCFFSGRYNNSEIGTSKCFSVLAERINGGVMISFVALDESSSLVQYEAGL